MNILKMKKLKDEGKKLSMITCYDSWSAKIIAATDIDIILVGDSGGMVMHGAKTPVFTTMEMMELHTRAVAKGAAEKFILSDMPFLAHRKGLIEAMNSVERLMKAGAHAVKIEGLAGNADTIKHIVESGVPVMGHLGLTAQSYHGQGGFRVQGRDEEAAEKIFADAIELERIGCFGLVLECIPVELAKRITEALTIPTIGIGAGLFVDGQVLVLHDMLGIDPDFKPKFVKQYLNGYELIKKAIEDYDRDVKGVQFPKEEHSFK